MVVSSTQARLGLTRSVAFALLGASGLAHAQSVPKDENGTNPTQLQRTLIIKADNLWLHGDGTQQDLKLGFTQPFGTGKPKAISVEIPTLRNTRITDGNGLELGDVTIGLTYVTNVTRRGGWVLRGELALDTGARPGYGSGGTVAELTVIRALFLRNHAIFAPTIAFSQDVGGDARVRQLVADFYYVPKLKDPRNFITLDPALTFNDVTDARFASLAVTLGRALPPAWGGRPKIYVKPAVYLGGDRPTDWSVEIGFKLLGF
jgi:hypothetical protein